MLVGTGEEGGRADFTPHALWGNYPNLMLAGGYLARLWVDDVCMPLVFVTRSGEALVGEYEVVAQFPTFARRMIAQRQDGAVSQIDQGMTDACFVQKGADVVQGISLEEAGQVDAGAGLFEPDGVRLGLETDAVDGVRCVRGRVDGNVEIPLRAGMKGQASL